MAGRLYNKREIGTQEEKKVAAYLQKHGYKIIECNYRVRQGEIDIIARQQEYLVFIEVKYRKNSGSGGALEAVGFQKQRQISKVALFYLASHNIPETQNIRFDVVGIDGDYIHLLKNAFDFIPYR